MCIGEGNKRNRNVVAIGNSDPTVVRLGVYWIRRFSSNAVALNSSTIEIKARKKSVRTGVPF